MLPKWFNDWNSEKPADIYRPAILIGTLGGAVLVVTLLVTWGQPFATTSLQTGPRGTGMSVPEFNSVRTSPDPTVELYYSEAPYEVAEDAPLARDVYENVQVLGGLTEDNFNRVMLAMTQWVAPDQGCAYCHGAGGPETYGSDDNYAKVVSRRMIQMTQNINENWSGHVNANEEVGVNCFTCHRGENVPSDIWFRITPLGDTMEGWGAVQNRVTMQSQYTSLPSDALETYLLDGEVIGVHDFESHVDSDPSDPETATWQNAERTYSLMNYMSNAQGVNCVFCHNSRAFNDGSQVTPQWATASLGIAMVLELNNDYLVPLKDIYPENRLGPVYADAPKAACKTCHKGYQRPLQGMNVIADWPELATTGDPVYATD
ncbi:photosynthetic reaction center cytochrome PufC [Roseivivax isoporae]|uniref:Photosynthetic reaction center cytochrome c subunit n=1 Tax=Roseivivax isoporae LMG 25204 TaxID=1449351 RepID=X7FBZ8_9RHOB|nr:photosynthetic reaction center cytochrome PufC [Roseivivax isoporae]ETX29616.1 Photosynthetic reaction center cytochrome C subunit [Roseivivax isoporae LMG 25204]